MEKAAAFLETRRYAALLGATTEFAKMEDISHNGADRKAYVVISRIEAGMVERTDRRTTSAWPATTAAPSTRSASTAGQRDTGGQPIRSRFVGHHHGDHPRAARRLAGRHAGRRGQPLPPGQGLRPGQHQVYSEGMRTLFIGEDTSRRNNNYVWAFNVDTRKLSRILSVPMYAEATGLQVVDDANGFSYLMSNFQHPAEQSQMGTFKGVKDATGAVILSEEDVLDAIDGKWGGRKKAAIGYVGHRERSAPGHPVGRHHAQGRTRCPPGPAPGRRRDATDRRAIAPERIRDGLRGSRALRRFPAGKGASPPSRPLARRGWFF